MTQPQTFEGRFRWETINIDLCIKIILVRNFLKIVAKNGSSVILEGRCSVTTSLISFMMVYISNLVDTESNSFQVSVSWFSCIKKCHHQFSDEFLFEVCSHSTSVFFSLSELFSSKVVSVEKLLLEKEGLVKKQLIMRFATKFWLSKLSKNLFLKMSDLDHRKVSLRKYWFDFGLHINNQTPYILRKIWFKYQPAGFRIKIWTLCGIFFILRKKGYCNHLRVSVCLFVCLFVCLLAGFLINYWSDFDEIWWVGRYWS